MAKSRPISLHLQADFVNEAQREELDLTFGLANREPLDWRANGPACSTKQRPQRRQNLASNKSAARAAQMGSLRALHWGPPIRFKYLAAIYHECRAGRAVSCRRQPGFASAGWLAGAQLGANLARPFWRKQVAVSRLTNVESSSLKGEIEIRSIELFGNLLANLAVPSALTCARKCPLVGRRLKWTRRKLGRRRRRIRGHNLCWSGKFARDLHKICTNSSRLA